MSRHHRLSHPLLALTPTEYNHTVRDLLGMPDDGEDWPDPPEIAERFTAYEGEQAGLFGIDPIEAPPWPWTLPEEAGQDGFQGMFEGQEPSAYQLEELQKAAVHFASYTLASGIFFTCNDWAAEHPKSCGWDSMARFAQRA